MHLSEVQRTDSALDIDLDFKQLTDRRQITDSNITQLVKVIIDAINVHCVVTEPFYLAVLQKTEIVKKQNIYKDGLHFRIFVKLNIAAKECIMNTVAENVIFEKLKINQNLISTDRIVDLQSLHAPVLLYGCNKPEVHVKPAYSLYNLLLIDGDNITTHYDDLVNPQLELSLLFNGNVVKKTLVTYKNPSITLSKTITPSDMEYYCRDQKSYIQYLVMKVLAPHRYEDREEWKHVLICLTELKMDKEIALDFSMQWSEWSDYKDMKSFENMWNWCITNVQSNQFALRKLEHWAAMDNEKLFVEIKQEYVNSTMINSLLTYISTDSFSEASCAECLRLKFGGKFIYVNKTQTWYIEDDKSYRWYQIEGKRYPNQFHEYISTTLYQNFINLKTCTTDPNVKKKITLAISKCRSTRFQNGVTTQAAFLFSSYPDIVFDDTDKYPWIIGVNNGIYNLQTNTLVREPNEYFVSRTMNASVHPEQLVFTEHELYNHRNPHVIELLNIVRDIIPDDKDRQYILCYIASGLNAYKKPPIFQLWIGSGKNGKSTIDELSLKMFNRIDNNGYGYKLPSSYLTSVRDKTGPDSTKMGLKYARYITSSEIEAGCPLCWSRIKELTSDTISGNEKYKTQESFMVKGVMILIANNKPKITSYDYGTWRRINIYYFPTLFTEAPTKINEKKCISHLDAKLVSNREYLDAWLIILIYYHNLLVNKYNNDITVIPKPAMDRELEVYKYEQDVLSRFIKAKVIKVEDELIDIGDFYQQYSAWYLSNMQERLKITRLDLENSLYKTCLEPYIKTRFGEVFIVHHRFVLFEEHRAISCSDVIGENEQPIENLEVVSLLDYDEPTVQEISNSVVDKPNDTNTEMVEMTVDDLLSYFTAN
jgi:phage/plasmid-associated DNA primase